MRIHYHDMVYNTDFTQTTDNNLSIEWTLENPTEPDIRQISIAEHRAHHRRLEDRT